MLSSLTPAISPSSPPPKTAKKLKRKSPNSAPTSKNPKSKLLDQSQLSTARWPHALFTFYRVLFYLRCHSERSEESAFLRPGATPIQWDSSFALCSAPVPFSQFRL